MRELVRRNFLFFSVICVAAFALRLTFIFRFPGVVTDSFIYGDIAKNWLQHGIYGLSGADEISPTYIRLPGYPAFLAFIFALFGMEHYRAVLFVQMFVDVGTCFLCADIARRLLGDIFAKAAFALAALCPFLADYSAAVLTETLEIFFTALAINFAITALQKSSGGHWAACGGACAGAILLRPDGALLLIALEMYLVMLLLSKHAPLGKGSQWRGVLILFFVSIAPLAPWTLRNWRTFQRIQPLAPRYANEEDEFVPMGFNRWVKTWMMDYTSVEEIYWNVPGSKIDAANLPARATDSEQQRTATEHVIDQYNDALHISPEIDRDFEALAQQRIHAHQTEYYLGLPLVRIIDMWARPRTEMLPCDSRWWEFNDEPKWSALAVVFGAINIAYLICAAVGFLKGRTIPYTGLLILFLVLRSGFLGTLENPEPRYTLEMYPIAIVFAAMAIMRKPISEESRSS